jgi:flagellar motor switch protein FliN/FliY
LKLRQDKVSDIFTSNLDQSINAETSEIDRLSIQSGKNLDLLMDVMLQVVVELGRTRMPLRQVLEIQPGSVVELDRLAGEAVDVFVNERLIAHGEVVMVDDKFGVRITDLVSSKNNEAV